jgi:DNA repair protein SbcC/Rad50
MRPLRLSFQAFGSFPRAETIDFSALASQGLFVVAGPTGSGKSTIFDAMTYALFGRLPGDRPDAEARSHHADAATETFVEFEFEVERGRFCVRRGPAHERPKLRGSGTTVAPATAHLVEVLPGGEHRPIAAKPGECSSLCAELVGLTAAEFQRVVLLPQGKFSSFLLANSGEREPLLRQLFGGELYQRATRHLGELTKTLRAEVAQFDEQLRHHLANAGTELDALRSAWADPEPGVAELPFHDGDAAPEAHTPESVAEALRQLELLEPARRATVDQLEHASVRAATELVRAESAATQWSHRQQLRETLALLQAAAPEREADHRRAEVAHRSAPVVEAVHDLGAADARAQVADAELTKALTDTRSLVDALGLANTAGLDADAGAGDHDVSVPAISAAAASRAAELGEHRRLLEAAAEAAATSRSALDDAAAARLAADHAARQLHEAEAAQDERAVRCRQLQPLAARFEATELQVAAATDRLHRRRRLDDSATALDAARAASDTAHVAYVEVMARYVATQAPRLAAELRPGQPCAVCGSCDHPAPASSEVHDLVDHDAVDQARVAHQGLATRVSTLEETVAQLRSALGDHADVDAGELAVQLDETRAQRDTAAQASSELAELERTIDEHQVAVLGLRGEVERATESAVALEATAAMSRVRADELAEQIAHLDPAQLDHDAAALAELERVVAELPALQHTRAGAFADVDSARGRLDHLCVVNGFQSVDEAMAAAMPAADLQRLDEMVGEWRTKLASTTERLATFDDVDLPDDRPDVEVLRDRAQSAAAAHDHARAVFHDQLGSIKRCRDSLAEVTRVGDESRHVRDRYDLVRHVFATCNGDTPARVTLETWVLAHELDRVTAMANVHLGRMTAHRYRLQRVDAAGGRGRTGLDLVVLDAHTGRSRATATLSGGEQFQASLALALGLADVVSHGGVSSGRSFDALFVDEGFGSLDPDALELAIDALQQLQATGRMVGAITHVEAMKQQLPVGIEVRRLADGGGSTLRVTER